MGIDRSGTTSGLTDGVGIFGANGFVGRHLVRSLAIRGISVRAVSRSFDESFVRNVCGTVEFVRSDLSSPKDVASSLRGLRSVVQLVSSSSPGTMNERMLKDIEENMLQQVSFLQACVRAGVGRIVFLSSGGTVYGPCAPIPTPETSATNPVSSYGLMKLMVEKYIQMFGCVEGLEYVILRVANLFGPGQEFRKGQGILPLLMERMMAKEPVTIFGDGSASRDYVYIDDVIDAIAAAIDLGGAPREILNIGSGETRTVNEVIQAVERATNLTVEREYVSPRGTDVGVSHLDISRAREILGWSPETSFSDGIDAVVGAEFKLDGGRSRT